LIVRSAALGLVLSFALLGCGSMHGGRTFAEADYRLDSEKALVFLFRHDEFMGPRIPSIQVAGIPPLQFRNHGYAVFYLKPGVHNVRISWSWDTRVAPTEHSLTVEGNRTYYVRMGRRLISTKAVVTGSPALPVTFLNRGETYVSPVTREDALRTLAECTSVHDAPSL
jgi:hypothetical protein